MLTTLKAIFTSSASDDQKERSFTLACKHNPAMINDIKVGIAITDDIISNMLKDPFWVEIITSALENSDSSIAK